MSDFRATIQTYIENNNLIPDISRPVIVGLSGGADSVALLNVLVDLGYICIPAHCNFQLRGEESERDEQFAVEYARSLGLKAETIRFDTTNYSLQQRISIEMAARELRYQWFEKLRIIHNACHIAVGHHADDTVETVLLNLIRGTGLKGLTGIKAANGFVIRPLLGVNREIILEYLRQKGLSFIEDSTNASNIYTRNKIRNQLIPLIQTINPAFTVNFPDTINNLNSGYQFLQSKIDELRSKLVQPTNTLISLSIKSFLQLGGDEYLLFELLKEYNFNKSQVKAIFASLDGISGKQFFSPTHSLLKDRDKLLIEQSESLNSTMLVEINYINISPEESFSISTNPRIAHLDADKLTFPLKVRTWKPGDYFYPLGMNRKKKISDLLIDRKIDRISKQSVYVVTTQTDNSEKIVWVAGIRIDHRFRVTKNTKVVAEIRLK